MKPFNTAILCVIFLLLAVGISAQDKLKADESPLSTAFYLLSTAEADDKVEQKACLAKSLAKTSRFGEIERVAQMAKSGSYADTNFVTVVNELISHGREKEALQFVSFLERRFTGETDKLQMLFGSLVRLKKDADALRILQEFDESDKIDGSFALTKAYLDSGHKEKASPILADVSELVGRSKYGEDKANLAYYYATLGNRTEALKFANEAMKTVTWTSGKPEYTEGRIVDRVFEIYKLLGKDEEAGELLFRQGIAEEPVSVLNEVQFHISHGNKLKANELLRDMESRLDPANDWDGIDLGRIAEMYLKLGNAEKAEFLVKRLKGNEYVLRRELLNISDFYALRNNKSRAYTVLRSALEETKQIDTSEPESGLMSTSGKWDRAQYESQIALRLMDMHFNKDALQVIAQIQKPYLRALALTEFVSVNKKRLSSSSLIPYLNEALALLRRDKTDVFDSKRFDVYAILARSFAELGLGEKANEIFTETLSKLDKEMREDGSDSSLLFAMCNIGVEFETSNIKADENLRGSLRNIIAHWENDDY
jgi:hypothetical protein